MTQDQAYTLTDHWALIAGVATLGVAAFALIAWSVRLAFWTETKIERVAMRVLEAALRSDAFDRAVQRLVDIVDVRSQGRLDLLRSQFDDISGETKRSIGRIHQRIDEMSADIKHLYASTGHRRSSDE